jgi:hypothetical protein
MRRRLVNRCDSCIYAYEPLEQALSEVCALFPQEFATICEYFVNTYGDIVISLMEQDLTVIF